MLSATIFNNERTTAFFFIIFYHQFLQFGYSKPVNVSPTIANLSVWVFEDANYAKGNEGHGPLKFNISWEASLNSSKASSYSVLITSMNKQNDGNSHVCPDETLFYTVRNGGDRCEIVLPENHYQSDAPELTVRPKCTYGIEIFANPRNNPKLKVPQVVLKVPECVGGWCDCQKSQDSLPIPIVEIASRTSESIEIKWKIKSFDSRVHSYVVSLAVPFLISNKQLPVYNITKIASVTSNVSSYVWSLNNTNSDVTAGAKIYVTAKDTVECFGNSGSALIDLPIKISASVQRTFYGFVWISLIGMFSMILGVAVTIFYNRSQRKYAFMWGDRATSGIQSLMAPLGLRSHWVNATLRERNVLYAEQEIQYPINRDGDDEFEISYERLKFIRELGEGQFGKVYQGQIIGDESSVVAIKISNCSDGGSEQAQARRQLLDEIQTMKNAGPHPHLVRLMATCTVPDKPICVILEYLEGGDLLAHLHRLRDFMSYQGAFYYAASCSRSKQSSLNETLYTMVDNQSPTTVTFPEYPTVNPADDSVKENNERPYVNVTESSFSSDYTDAYNDLDGYRFASFALDIARGMAHLEDKGIIHRDLAARNILLTKDFTLKISDFGLSRNDGVYIIGNGESGVRRLPVRWMAPEAIRDREFTSKSDVWSFAVVLWEIGTFGAFPYSEIEDKHLLRHVLRDDGRLERPENVTNEIYDLMRSCWSTRPENRPNFAQLVKRLLALGETTKFFTAMSNPCYSLFPTVFPTTKFDSIK